MPTKNITGKKRKDMDESKTASAVPQKMRSPKRTIVNSPSFGAASSGGLPPFVSLTTHAGRAGVKPIEVNWGAATPDERGPIIATNRDDGVRNCIGAHGGSYCIYRGLAVAAGALDPDYRPQLKMTIPAMTIGPYPSWSDPTKIVTMDPYGHECRTVFDEYFQKGYDIRPTIAVTKAHIDIPEIKVRMRDGFIKPDGKVRSCGTCVSCLVVTSSPGGRNADLAGIWPGEHLQGCCGARVAPAWRRRSLRLLRGDSAPPPVPPDQRHVPGAADAE